MAAGALADPEPQRSARPSAQFLDRQAGRTRAIHKDRDVRALDHDAGVKPFIAVGFRDDGLFVLVGAFRPELFPGPGWMGDVLHRVTVARRVGRPKVEWPEV